MNNFYGWDIDSNAANEYINACKIICENDQEFLNFKSNKKYQVILEHVDESLGHQYFNHIKNTDENIFEEYFHEFSQNDSIGNPNLICCNDKYISPTTLRYIKNTIDLKSLCSNSEIKKIVEIGGGYGGLCKTVSVLCDFDEYIHIDLPDVIKLQEKYLKNFSELYSKVKFLSCDNLDSIYDIDLLISNYSLSELNIESQLNYFEKVIKNSKILYITYNAIINSEKNYNIIVEKIKGNGFFISEQYKDYDGYHNNIIIAAKK